MAIQPTKFAIVLVSGFESRVAVSRLGLSPEHGTRNTRLETVFLPASSLHVRDMRRFDVQLEPTRAAVFAAEDIAVLLRRVHSIEVHWVKGKSFHEALVRS